LDSMGLSAMGAKRNSVGKVAIILTLLTTDSQPPMAEDKDEFDAFTLIDSPIQDDRDLAAMLFAETSPPPEDATQTVTGEAAPAPEETVEEAPQKPGLLARLKGLFRRAPAPAESDEEAPPAPAEEGEGEATLAAPNPRKKTLLVALAALTLL